MLIVDASWKGAITTSLACAVGLILIWTKGGVVWGRLLEIGYYDRRLLEIGYYDRRLLEIGYYERRLLEIGYYERRLSEIGCYSLQGFSPVTSC